MKHTYCTDKLFEFNNRIFLFIKKIKNLHGDIWKVTKFQKLKMKSFKDSTSYEIYQIVWQQFFFLISFLKIWLLSS
jgi:hypothetical protein